MADLGYLIWTNLAPIAARLTVVASGAKTVHDLLTAVWDSPEFTTEEKNEIQRKTNSYLTSINQPGHILIKQTPVHTVQQLDTPMHAAQQLAHSGTLSIAKPAPMSTWRDAPRIAQPFLPSEPMSTWADAPKIVQPVMPDETNVTPGHGLLQSISLATTASSASGTFGYSSQQTMAPRAGATNLASVTGATLNAIVRARPPPSTSGVY